MCRRLQWRKIPAPVPLLSSVYLRSELSRHEGGDRAASRLTLEEYSVHGINNWHFHSLACRELASALRGDNSFRDGFSVLQDIFEPSSLPQLDTYSPIPAERPGAGQHQVTQAGQPGEGTLLRPERRPEPRHLGKPARDESGLGIEAEAEAFGDSCGDGHHVLESSTELDANHVGMRVRAKVGRAEGTLCNLGRPILLRCHDDRCGLTRYHFGREARPRQGNHRRGGNLLLSDVRHERQSLLLDSLRC